MPIAKPLSTVREEGGNGSFKRRAKLHEAEAANVLTQHIIMSDELRRRQREARLLQLVRDLARIGAELSDGERAPKQRGQGAAGRSLALAQAAVRKV